MAQASNTGLRSILVLLLQIYFLLLLLPHLQLAHLLVVAPSLLLLLDLLPNLLTQPTTK